MTIHGAGSLKSPIVISDDEDEACVELELEQRLSSPREGMELDFDDDIPDGLVLQDTSLENFWYQDSQRLNSLANRAAPNGRPLHGTTFWSLIIAT